MKTLINLNDNYCNSKLSFNTIHKHGGYFIDLIIYHIIQIYTLLYILSKRLILNVSRNPFNS